MPLRKDRFERIALVLSGGGALAAYQAGAFATLAGAGFQPDWLAGVATGAVNAAIIAGNPPPERIPRLGRFWRRLGELAAGAPPTSSASGIGAGMARLFGRRGQTAPASLLAAPLPMIDPVALRTLLGEMIDFDRINTGALRVAFGATHLSTGAEICFDNDCHRLTLDHLVASLAAPPGFAPGSIDGQLYGNQGALPATPVAALLDRAPPADSLCFVIDCFDPAPEGGCGVSRSRQQIADYRRRHELRRIIHLLGERLPDDEHDDPEMRRCLTHGADATMNIVHLVHESSAVDLALKMADYTRASLMRRWQAGERDMTASLARPAWLAPPSRRSGVVVHEIRGGTSSVPQ